MWSILNILKCNKILNIIAWHSQTIGFMAPEPRVTMVQWLVIEVSMEGLGKWQLLCIKIYILKNPNTVTGQEWNTVYIMTFLNWMWFAAQSHWGHYLAVQWCWNNCSVSCSHGIRWRSSWSKGMFLFPYPVLGPLSPYTGSFHATWEGTYCWCPPAGTDAQCQLALASVLAPFPSWMLHCNSQHICNNHCQGNAWAICAPLH